jgi:hypothetical protein
MMEASMGKKKDQEPEIRGSVLFRSMDMEIRSLNAEERTAEVSFSSETDQVKRWFGTEILSHKPGAVDLSRLKVGAHLFNHDPDQIIGPIKDAWVEEGRGKAVVGYDETEEGERAFKRTQNKSLRGISVGYIPLKAVALEEGQKWEGATKTFERKGGDGPIFIITRWSPLEISSTPVPADPGVGIGRENGNELERIEFEKLTEEEKEMEPKEVKEAIREVLKETPMITMDDVKRAIEEANKPKQAQMNLSLDEHRDLLARADAISPAAVREFCNMAADQLLRMATGNPDAAAKTGPGGDGTGRDASKQAKVEIESMTDDEFLRMVTNPTYDLLQ